MPDNTGNADRLDRIEQALEHLISVQASHDNSITGLFAVQAQHQARLDRIESHLEGLAGDIESLVSLIRTLAEQADRRFADLAEAQRHTDERLNSLIKMVDDIVRGRGPEPPQPTA